MDDIKIIQLSPDRWQEYKDLRLEMLLKNPQAFGQSYDKSLNDPDSKWEDRLEASRRRDKFLMFFAESNGKVVGTIGAYFNFDEETKDTARVFSVYVDKSFRGMGIAGKMQKELIRELKGISGIKKVKVRVNKSQESAVSLYKQGNFQITKTEKMILGDGKEYEVYTMEQELKRI